MKYAFIHDSRFTWTILTLTTFFCTRDSYCNLFVIAAHAAASCFAESISVNFTAKTWHEP